MLTPKQLENSLRDLLRFILEVETDIIADTAARISKMDLYRRLNGNIESLLKWRSSRGGPENYPELPASESVKRV